MLAFIEMFIKISSQINALERKKAKIPKSRIFLFVRYITTYVLNNRSMNWRCDI